MKTQGNFYFKGIEEREGGKFINNNGKEITFEPSFLIKVDELDRCITRERTFKFPRTNLDLAEKFKSINLYENINIIFDISLFNNNVKLTPVDVIFNTEDNS